MPVIAGYWLSRGRYNEARDVSTAFKRCEDWNQFQSILNNEGITTSFRNSFGRSIDAACGQL